ncbi:hypothetical protein QJQ45_007989 [Haematococcus lacustris]|nr:hypothetical protein QJQ45_007989 [Haematococcus lacustris]
MYWQAPAMRDCFYKSFRRHGWPRHWTMSLQDCLELTGEIGKMEPQEVVRALCKLLSPGMPKARRNRCGTHACNTSVIAAVAKLALHGLGVHQLPPSTSPTVPADVASVVQQLGSTWASALLRTQVTSTTGLAMGGCPTSAASVGHSSASMLNGQQTEPGACPSHPGSNLGEDRVAQAQLAAATLRQQLMGELTAGEGLLHRMAQVLQRAARQQPPPGRSLPRKPRKPHAPDPPPDEQLAVDVVEAWGCCVTLLGPALMQTPGLAQAMLNVRVVLPRQAEQCSVSIPGPALPAVVWRICRRAPLLLHPVLRTLLGRQPVAVKAAALNCWTSYLTLLLNPRHTHAPTSSQHQLQHPGATHSTASQAAAVPGKAMEGITMPDTAPPGPTMEGNAMRGKIILGKLFQEAAMEGGAMQGGHLQGAAASSLPPPLLDGGLWQQVVAPVLSGVLGCPGADPVGSSGQVAGADPTCQPAAAGASDPSLILQVLQALLLLTRSGHAAHVMHALTCASHDHTPAPLPAPLPALPSAPSPHAQQHDQQGHEQQGHDRAQHTAAAGPEAAGTARAAAVLDRCLSAPGGLAAWLQLLAALLACQRHYAPPTSSPSCRPAPGTAHTCSAPTPGQTHCSHTILVPSSWLHLHHLSMAALPRLSHHTHPSARAANSPPPSHPQPHPHPQALPTATTSPVPPVSSQNRPEVLCRPEMLAALAQYALDIAAVCGAACSLPLPPPPSPPPAHPLPTPAPASSPPTPHPHPQPSAQGTGQEGQGTARRATLLPCVVSFLLHQVLQPIVGAAAAARCLHTSLGDSTPPLTLTSPPPPPLSPSPQHLTASSPTPQKLCRGGGAAAVTCRTVSGHDSGAAGAIACPDAAPAIRPKQPALHYQQRAAASSCLLQAAAALPATLWGRLAGGWATLPWLVPELPGCPAWAQGLELVTSCTGSSLRSVQLLEQYSRVLCRAAAPRPPPSLMPADPATPEAQRRAPRQPSTCFTPLLRPADQPTVSPCRPNAEAPPSGDSWRLGGFEGRLPAARLLGWGPEDASQAAAYQGLPAPQPPHQLDPARPQLAAPPQLPPPSTTPQQPLPPTAGPLPGSGPEEGPSHKAAAPDLQLITPQVQLGEAAQPWLPAWVAVEVWVAAGRQVSAGMACLADLPTNALRNTLLNCVLTLLHSPLRPLAMLAGAVHTGQGEGRLLDPVAAGREAGHCQRQEQGLGCSGALGLLPGAWPAGRPCGASAAAWSASLLVCILSDTTFHTAAALASTTTPADPTPHPSEDYMLQPLFQRSPTPQPHDAASHSPKATPPSSPSARQTPASPQLLVTSPKCGPSPSPPPCPQRATLTPRSPLPRQLPTPGPTQLGAASLAGLATPGWSRAQQRGGSSGSSGSSKLRSAQQSLHAAILMVSHCLHHTAQAVVQDLLPSHPHHLPPAASEEPSLHLPTRPLLHGLTTTRTGLSAGITPNMPALLSGLQAARWLLQALASCCSAPTACLPALHWAAAAVEQLQAPLAYLLAVAMPAVRAAAELQAKEVTCAARMDPLNVLGKVEAQARVPEGYLIEQSNVAGLDAQAHAQVQAVKLPRPVQSSVAGRGAGGELAQAQAVKPVGPTACKPETGSVTELVRQGLGGVGLAAAGAGLGAASPQPQAPEPGVGFGPQALGLEAATRKVWLGLADVLHSCYRLGRGQPGEVWGATVAAPCRNPGRGTLPEQQNQKQQAVQADLGWTLLSAEGRAGEPVEPWLLVQRMVDGLEPALHAALLYPQAAIQNAALRLCEACQPPVQLPLSLQLAAADVVAYGVSGLQGRQGRRGQAGVATVTSASVAATRQPSPQPTSSVTAEQTAPRHGPFSPPPQRPASAALQPTARAGSLTGAETPPPPPSPPAAATQPPSRPGAAVGAAPSRAAARIACTTPRPALPNPAGSQTDYVLIPRPATPTAGTSPRPTNLLSCQPVGVPHQVSSTHTPSCSPQPGLGCPSSCAGEGKRRRGEQAGEGRPRSCKAKRARRTSLLTYTRLDASQSQAQPWLGSAASSPSSPSSPSAPSSPCSPPKVQSPPHNSPQGGRAGRAAGSDAERAVAQAAAPALGPGEGPAQHHAQLATGPAVPLASNPGGRPALSPYTEQAHGLAPMAVTQPATEVALNSPAAAPVSHLRSRFTDQFYGPTSASQRDAKRVDGCTGTPAALVSWQCGGEARRGGGGADANTARHTTVTPWSAAPVAPGGLPGEAAAVVVLPAQQLQACAPAEALPRVSDEPPSTVPTLLDMPDEAVGPDIVAVPAVAGSVLGPLSSSQAFVSSHSTLWPAVTSNGLNRQHGVAEGCLGRPALEAQAADAVAGAPHAHGAAVVEQRKEQTEDGNLQPGPGAVVEKQFEAQGQPDVVDPAADDRELVTSPSSSCRAAASQLELESSQGQSQVRPPPSMMRHWLRASARQQHAEQGRQGPHNASAAGDAGLQMAVYTTQRGGLTEGGPREHVYPIQSSLSPCMTGNAAGMAVTAGAAGTAGTALYHATPAQAGAPSAGRAGTGPVPDLLLATTCAAIGKVEAARHYAAQPAGAAAGPHAHPGPTTRPAPALLSIQVSHPTPPALPGPVKRNFAVSGISRGSAALGAASAGHGGRLSLAGGLLPLGLTHPITQPLAQKPEPEVAGGAAQQLLDAHCLPAQGQQQQQVQGLTALEAGTPGSSAALPVVPDAPASPAPPATPAALVSSPLNTTPGSFGGQLLLSLAALAGHPGWQELHDPPQPPAQDPPPPPAQAPPPPPPAQAQPLPAAPGPAPPPQAPPGGRWLDRDTNGCLNLQRIGESRQRPIELCRWDDLEALPPIGKEYQQGYKRVNDRLPKGRQWLHRAAEYRRGIDGRARNNA